MAANLAKGKAKVGYVLPEKMIEKIKHRAATRKLRPSHYLERIVKIGIKYEAKMDREKRSEPESASASA